ATAFCRGARRLACRDWPPRHPWYHVRTLGTLSPPRPASIVSNPPRPLLAEKEGRGVVGATMRRASAPATPRLVGRGCRWGDRTAPSSIYGARTANPRQPQSE